jgi:hypothetical protein
VTSRDRASLEAPDPADGGDDESRRAARHRFIERLHARSDDFEATNGLRALEAAERA